MKKIIKLVNFLEIAILMIGMPVMVALVFTGVVFRYFALGSMSWGEEAARYVMIWVVFAGISYAFRVHAHLGLSFFVDMLPDKLRLASKYLKQLIILIFGIVTTYLSAVIIQTQFITNQLSPTMGVPLWLVYMALLFGMFMIIVRTITAIINLSGSNNQE